MIDRLIGVYAGYKYKSVDNDYSPTDAIQSTSVKNEDASQLTVLFPPWRGGDYFYDILEKRLVRSGSAVLRYSFSHQILQPNVRSVLESFEFIQKSIVRDITELQKKHNYQHTALFASSLGNVSLAVVANALPNFDSATMVVAGSNLARSSWEGSRTQSLREKFMEQGLDEESLDTQWSKIAPSAAVGAFKNKPVKFILSETDNIIPSKYQHEMLTALHEAGAIVHTQAFRSGHIATIARYCLNGAV